MKILIKLFILINFIYSKEICNFIEPNITFGQIGCENPKIEINNYRDYDDITFVPNPISKSFVLPNNLIVALDFGINYRISFINDKCIDYISRSFQTKDGPRFKSTKGACSGSKGSIEFIPDPEISLSYYTFYINGKLKNFPFYSIPGTYSVEAKTEEGFSCQDLITIPDSNIQSEKKPQVKLTNPTCENNGEVQVLNINDYISVFLQNDVSFEFYEQSSPGLFKNVQNRKLLLTTKDNDCGEIQHAYYVMDDVPLYQLEIVNNTCPKSPLVNLIWNSSLSYQIINDHGEIQTNPFIADRDMGYVIISSYVGYCKPYRITLLYDSNDFTNLQIFKNSDEIVELDQNKSFIAEADSLYYVRNPCYNSLLIGKTNPKPYLKYIKKGKFCLDLVDIQIVNWEDFSFIELKTYGDQPLKYSMEYGGIFKNVLYQELDVDYVHYGCSETLTTTFDGGISPYVTQSDIDYTIDHD
ncbi:hypothetical protein ACTFIY_002145 [Dictyostelium cf. discoideum]